MRKSQRRFNPDQSSKLSQAANQRLNKIVVYQPESQLKNPIQLFKEMGRDLLGSRELAWRLLVRDISAEYRQSFLGFVWAFLPPVVTAIGFAVAKSTNVINIGATDLPYPAYVMFSTAIWQIFVEALTGPIQAVNTGKPMLTKINFPHEALILAKLGQVFFNFGIKLILIIGLFIFFKISISWTIILAPVALIHLVMLGTFIGLALAPLGALYQDFLRGLILLTGLWMFLTPVVYPVPGGSGIFSNLVKWNPVTPLLVTTRELATTGIVSDPYHFWLVSIISFVGLLLAWVVYRLSIPFVIERIGS
jgi:lipopolysaccharide transport system permease protein